MSNVKKLMMTAAGGDFLNVEDVFSAYTYQGTGSTRTITNNIDLDGNGGLVWLKGRDTNYNNYMATSLDGTDGFGWFYSNTTNSILGAGGSTFQFNSDGFTTTATGVGVNGSGNWYQTWTFRKAPKFFDIVEFTGDGSNNQAIAHNLGCAIGMMIIKNKNDSASGHLVWHRGTGNSKYGVLNLTQQFYPGSGYWPQAFTDTHFYVSNSYGDQWLNKNGNTYVAYIFAHNNNTGEFGPTGDQDIIKCSTFNASYSGDVFVDLQFEPQFLMVKKRDTAGDWQVVDTTRLWATGHDGVGANEAIASILRWNSNQSEFNGDIHEPWNRGFIRRDHHQYTDGGETYIYMAIRRGPMKPPESASDVFALSTDITNLNNNLDRHSIYAGWPIDSAFLKRNINTTASNEWYDRIRPYDFKVDEDNSPRQEGSGFIDLAKMEGWWEYGGSTTTNNISYMWRRAAGFYEVATWDGNSSAGRNITHTLGVVPEMMWVKNRDSNVDWAVYHKDLGNTKYLTLNRDYAAQTATNYWNNTSPTSSIFTLGNSGLVNYSNDGYIGYFFATYAGISKVGSYTGNGSNGKVIDCGFTNGARFVLIKCTSSAGNWWTFDTARGINAGNDPMFKWDRDQAEINNSYDEIDYHSSGFIVNYSAGEVNISGEDYIFYAIA